MSVTHDHSTRAYQREADETRRRLSSSLDELAANLTPGHVLDEVLSYARAGGADFLRGLGNAASANPMPTLLIGLGAAMFLTGKGRVDTPAGDRNGTAGHGASVLRHAADAMRRRPVPRYSGPDVGEMATSASRGVASAASNVAGSVGSAASNAADAVGSAAAGAAGAVRSAASSAAGAVGSAASSATDAIGSAASSVTHAVGSAADAVGSTASRVAGQLQSGAATVGSAAADAAGTVRDTAAAGMAAAGDFVSSAAGTVGEGARAAADSVGQFAGMARDTATEQSQHLFDQTTQLARDLLQRTNRLIQEQPLAVAAAGLAIGAAIAAVLPRTRTEDQVLGETSDAVKDTVAGAAAEQFQHAKEATGRVVEEVKNVAEKEGLSATAAADAVRDIGDKVRKVVTAAGDQMADKKEGTPQSGVQWPRDQGPKTWDQGPNTWDKGPGTAKVG